MKPGLAARRTFGPSRALAAAALFCALVAPWRALAGTEPAVARFSWSGGQPPPAAVHVVPPSVEFGQVVALVVDAEPGTPLPPTGALAVDADWLVPDLAAPPPDLSALPAAAGPRLVVPMRIYHLGPWRAAWGAWPRRLAPI